MANRGRFIPKNPHKYAGDVSKVLFRSSWELKVMQFLDSSSAIVRWASEELAIPYIKPTDMRVHKYFPDFVVIFTDASGNIHKEVWEIKPLKESLAENAKNDHDKIALAINVAKWKSAEEFCIRYGMKFRVMTEKTLFRQGPPKVKKARTPKMSPKPSKRLK